MNPDLIIHNAKIYTVDPQLLWAEAVACHNGRFLSIGANDKILTQAGSQTKLIDGNGRLLLPGLIDSHIHFLDVAVRNQLITPHIPEPTFVDKAAWLRPTIATANSLGLTGIHDQRIEKEGQQSFRLWQALNQHGELNLRVHMNIAADFLPEVTVLYVRCWMSSLNGKPPTQAVICPCPTASNMCRSSTPTTWRG